MNYSGITIKIHKPICKLNKMKTTYIFTLLFLFTSVTYAQELEQKMTVGKSYKTGVEMTVNYIDGSAIKSRTALAGLKYKYIETVDKKVYIRFFDITTDIPAAKGNDTFVNSDNDHITYFILQDDLNDFNRQKTLRLITGTMLAPIKIRPEVNVEGTVVPWELSTDIALGQYLGLRIPISKKNPFYITIPTFTLGTSLLSINRSNTSPESESSTTLGLTWSTGVILDLNSFNIGFLIGRDYAPGVSGSDWIYNEKTWLSIGFGINFTSKNKDL
jgi:hypothetical protein